MLICKPGWQPNFVLDVTCSSKCSEWEFVGPLCACVQPRTFATVETPELHDHFITTCRPGNLPAFLGFLRVCGTVLEVWQQQVSQVSGRAKFGPL